MNNNVLKGILITALVLYILSPVDICPGNPIDDIVVLLIGISASKKSPVNIG